MPSEAWAQGYKTYEIEVLLLWREIGMNGEARPNYKPLELRFLSIETKYT